MCGRPLGLWVKGPLRLDELGGAVAVVGSRAATTYGEDVARDVAAGLARHGRGVVSGAAFGIDQAAHSAALATGTAHPPTVSVMACGIDRLYPPGNHELLHRVEAAGLLLAEAAPGCTPSRYRFLQRNRIIAALSAGTVVVEARWRSGAQNTAHHADGLSRPVGAVPGSVHAGTSAGCHRLVREGTGLAEARKRQTT